MKKIIILAGPSAVGKTTLADYMIKSGMGVELVRSATTRAPRGDAHDSEYIYMNVKDFIALAEGGGMLEYTEYAGALYGTPKSEVERISEKGLIPLLILDINGVDSIKSANEYPSLAIYLYENICTLEERLYARYLTPPTTDGLAAFIKRKERNFDELLRVEEISTLFDAFVENKDIEGSAGEILKIYGTGSLGEEKAVALEKIKMGLRKNEGGQQR